MTIIDKIRMIAPSVIKRSRGQTNFGNFSRPLREFRSLSVQRTGPMAEVPELAVEVDAKNYEPGLLEIFKAIRPEWKTEEIKFKFLRQGYVNHMITCYRDEENKDEWIVTRIYGDVDFFQQRDVEVKCSQLFSELDIGPHLYCIFKNGYCSSFVKGKTYFWDDLTPFKEEKLARAVARELAKIHSEKTFKVAKEKYDMHKARSMEQLIRQMLEVWPETIIDEETTEWYNREVPTKEERKKEILMLMEKWEDWKISPSLCHGDSNVSNVIYDEEQDKATLVDYEGTGLSVPLFDLSGFLMTSSEGLAPVPSEENSHTPEYERAFFAEYLREKRRIDEGTDELDEKILERYLAIHGILKIQFNYFFHLMVVTLATAPKRHDTDPKMFLQLGVSRLRYYEQNRDRMLAMVIPE